MRWSAQPDRGRAALRLAAALIVVAAGCGKADPGTDVQRLAADLVFGIKDTSAAPANFGPLVAQDAGDAEGPPDFPVSKFKPPLSNPQVPCPAAALNAFPAEEAGLNIGSRPREGLYRWKKEGTQTLTSVPGFTFPVGGFETRAIRRLTRTTDTSYTFQTVQTEFGGRTVVTTWTVNTAATTQTVNPPVGPVVRTGDPERGLVLSRIQTFDGKGALLGTFAPTPGVLYLPLPVLPGEGWTAQGVDPTTGQVLQHDGTVTKRDRVDACGEMIDGWRVEGSEQFQNAAGGQVATRTYSYIVATQLGGILIAEDVDGQTAEGTLKAKFNIGQLDPAPLPVELK